MKLFAAILSDSFSGSISLLPTYLLYFLATYIFYVFLVVDFASLCHYLFFSFYNPIGFDTVM